ncbi:MAG: IS1380 family transposase [Thiohalospira sp.]
MNLFSKKDNEKNTINPQEPTYELLQVNNKKIELQQTAEKTSSDGGLLLLKEVEEQIKLIKDLTNCIKDKRNQKYIKHELYSLLNQRIFQIAAGYEDTNDCDSLNTDSIFKLCAGKLPSESSLSSQPTMCRFENSVTNSDLYRMAACFANKFIASYETEPAVIILDCDDTNNNAYGNQQLSIFNNYYNESCFMPLHVYEGLSGKLITTILKPGRRSKSVNIFSILKRIIHFIRKSWKNTLILLRGDSHFCSSDFINWKENQEKIGYITGLSGNPILRKLSETTIQSAENKYKKNQMPVKMYHTFEYKANSWQESQRVIVKVEVNYRGTNIRYIVTDQRQFRTKKLYETGYCKRGKMELYIKEHKTYLKSDRTSCNSFKANQFRLFLHSAAYVLIHSLQQNIFYGTKFYKATKRTIQLKIIKTAAHVKELKTKIKIIFPSANPQKNLLANSFNIFEVLRN